MNSDNAASMILIYSTAVTAIAMIVLFAVGILPLWLAAVIIVADAVFAWFMTSSMRSRT
jgi:hypothetical protein